MTANPNRWLMHGSEPTLTPADSDASSPGTDEVVVEIDACSLWHSDAGFEFGGVHKDAAHSPTPRVSGHVIDAGDNALFYIDRAVTLDAVVPCGKQQQCWLGGATTCPNKSIDGACAHDASASIVTPARNVNLAEKHKPAPLGPGLTPFKDG